MTAETGTFPERLVAQARRIGPKVALREKKYGIWQEVTWTQYAAHVRAICLGLVRLGLERGDRIAVICGNRPAWLYVELAAQSAGAIPLGIYVDSLPDQVERILDHSEARFVLVEDQEQADKVLGVRGALPRLERIIVDDMRGLEGYRDPMIVSLAVVAEDGRGLEGRADLRYDEMLGQSDARDVALLAYTSGTTGAAKAAMISHRNLLSMAAGVTDVDPLHEADQIFSFLPFAWVGEQLLSVAIALHVGATVNFPEEPETLREDLREIGPHVLIAPPRFWEAMCSEYQVKIDDAGLVKRLATRAALAIGERVSTRRNGARTGWTGRALYGVAYAAALRAMLDKLGLSRIRYAYSGGAPLGAETFEFFRALGLNLKQVYGQTETSGICVLHRDADVRAETVGTPTAGTRIRISDAGEVLVASDSVFVGYWKNPDATKRVLDDDGWLRTGDAGLVDDAGHLVVIDRLQDVLRLVDGSRVAAALIENKLKFSPYVREAVVIGEDRPHVVALVQIDMGTVGNWAEDRRVPFTTFKDLSRKPEVFALIGEAVARVNAGLPAGARIGGFALFDKELDADDDELTRTQKVRRATIVRKYAAMIDDLYAAGARAGAGAAS
jgi:long-chain acyl-CoA synthetase